MNILGAFLLIAVLTVPYMIWTSIQCRQMEPASDKYKISENFTTQAREHNSVTLWLLEAGSIAFVAIGIYILFADKNGWFIALATIIFFGLCALVFAKMILIKNQQRI